MATRESTRPPSSWGCMPNTPLPNDMPSAAPSTLWIGKKRAGWSRRGSVERKAVKQSVSFPPHFFIPWKEEEHWKQVGGCCCASPAFGCHGHLACA